MAEDQSQAKTDKPQASRGKNPLDQRLVQVARVVMATKDHVERLSKVVTDLTERQQQIDELSSELKQQLGTTTGELGRQIADAMSNLAGQREFSEEAHQRANELLESAASAAERLSHAQGQLAGRIDKLQHDVSQAIEGIDASTARAELANSKLDEQVFALKGRVTAFTEGVEEWFKPARHEIEANREIVERASEQIRQQLEAFEREVLEYEGPAN